MALVTTETRPLPPLVHGLPILGSALAMQKELIPFLTRSYQQYGPIFRVRALNQELVVLAGPEANTFVTQQGADKFSSHEAWTPYVRESGAETSMQNIDGEQHTTMRKLLKPDFSAARLVANIPLLVDIVQGVTDTLPVGAEIAALTLFRSIVTEQLGRVLANYSPAEYFDDIVTTVRVSLNVFTNGKWPKAMLRTPKYQRAKRRFRQLGETILTRHRTTTQANPDLIDTVLRASKEDDYQFAFGTEEQIMIMALAPFVAGLDTVSNECTFALYALLENPTVLAQCVEDADRIFAKGLPDLNQLKTMGPLHHAMMETLRCYSIAPAIDRTAARDFEFAGYRVPKGQRVLIATTVAHFLPELYAEPERFDIERYSEPRKEHKQRGAYVPFGIGPHTCLGAGAAEVQIMLTLAAVLHFVRLERVKPQEKLAIKTDPTPTLGAKLKVRVAERRHHLDIDLARTSAPVPEDANID